MQNEPIKYLLPKMVFAVNRLLGTNIVIEGQETPIGEGGMYLVIKFCGLVYVLGLAPISQEPIQPKEEAHIDMVNYAKSLCGMN